MCRSPHVKKWSASLVKNAQISLLCLIGETGWWVDGWDIGIGIGIGRGGIATGIAKQSTSIGSPVLCCCISPWGGRQIENVRNIRTFTLSFSSSLLWEGFRKNVKHFFPIFELLPLPFVIGSCKIVRNFRCAHCRKWLTIQTLKLELILRKRKIATSKVFSLFWMVRLKVDLEICPERTAWESFPSVILQESRLQIVQEPTKVTADLSVVPFCSFFAKEMIYNFILKHFKG